MVCCCFVKLVVDSNGELQTDTRVQVKQVQCAEGCGWEACRRCEQQKDASGSSMSNKVCWRHLALLLGE